MSDEPLNTDQLVAKMKEDERTSVVDILCEALGLDEGVYVFKNLKLMSPREYAQARDMTPQVVYYYIRQGVIEPLECLCGRHVIDAKQAEQALEARQKARGKKLDTSGESGE